MGDMNAQSEDPFAPEAFTHEVAVSFWWAVLLAYAVLTLGLAFMVAWFAAHGLSWERLCFMGVFFGVTLIPSACILGAFLSAVGSCKISSSGIIKGWVSHEIAVDWGRIRSVHRLVPGLLLLVRAGDPWQVVLWPGRLAIKDAAGFKELLDRLSPEDCPLRQQYPWTATQPADGAE